MDIKLRALEERDLEQLRDWRNADWLRPYVREYRLLNMENQREWFESMSRDREVAMFGISCDALQPRKAGGVLVTHETDLIGVCGLTHISWVNRTAEISLYILPEQQGQGRGRSVLELLQLKAFQEYNLRRLWAEVYANYDRHIALFEEAGYRREGCLRQHIFKGGAYIDSYLYGLVRNDE